MAKPWERKYAEPEADGPWNRTYAVEDGVTTTTQPAPKEEGALPDWLMQSLVKLGMAVQPHLPSTDRKTIENQLEIAAARAREAGQGATLEWGDEALAAINSAMGGGTYEEEHKIQQENRKKARKKLGETGASAMNIAGSFAVPGGAVSALRNAPLAVRALVGGVSGLAGGTAHVAGSQPGAEKDVRTAAIQGGIPGLVFGGGMPIAGKLGSMAYNQVRPYGTAIAEVLDFGRFARTGASKATPKGASQYVPMAASEREAAFALDRSLDKAKIKTQGDLYRAVARNRAAETAAPTIVGLPKRDKHRFLENVQKSDTLPEETNTIITFAKGQIAPGGRSQGERAATRFAKAAGIAKRPATVIKSLQKARKALGDKIGELREKGGNTKVGGIGKMLDSNNYLRRQYASAVDEMAGPGAGQIRKADMPLLPSAYKQAKKKYDAGLQRAQRADKALIKEGKAPTNLKKFNDENVRPKELKDDIDIGVFDALWTRLSNKSISKSVGRGQGVRGARAVSEATPSAGRTPGSLLKRRKRQIHELHNEEKEFRRGLGFSGRKGEAAIDDEVSLAGLSGTEREARRQGVGSSVSGDIRHIMDDFDGDASAVAKKIFGDTDKRRRFEQVINSPNIKKGDRVMAKAMVDDLRRVQRSLDLGRDTIKALGRRVDQDPDIAGISAELSRRAAFSTGYAATTGLAQMKNWVPEARRHAEIALVLKGPKEAWAAIERARKAILDAGERTQRRVALADAVAQALWRSSVARVNIGDE